MYVENVAKRLSQTEWKSQERWFFFSNTSARESLRVSTKRRNNKVLKGHSIKKSRKIKKMFFSNTSARYIESLRAIYKKKYKQST